MTFKKVVGLELILIAGLISLAYYVTIENPYETFNGKTLNEWQAIGDYVEKKSDGKIIVWNGQSGSIQTGSTYNRELSFNSKMFIKIIIYGICSNFAILGFYLLVEKKRND